MRRIFGFGLVLLLSSCGGCLSMGAFHAAKRDSTGVEPMEGGSPRPGYYYLLALTVPADIATLPIQGVVYLMFRNVDNGH